VTCVLSWFYKLFHHFTGTWWNAHLGEKIFVLWTTSFNQSPRYRLKSCFLNAVTLFLRLTFAQAAQRNASMK